jgi:bacterioferritin-associated ferredoxin
MYVCVCLAVTEVEVQAAIEGGAHNREAVTRACGAGGDCGACHGMIDAMLEDHLETAVTAPVAKVACPAPSPSAFVEASALVRSNRAA